MLLLCAAAAATEQALLTNDRLCCALLDALTVALESPNCVDTAFVVWLNGTGTGKVASAALSPQSDSGASVPFNCSRTKPMLNQTYFVLFLRGLFVFIEILADRLVHRFSTVVNSVEELIDATMRNE